MKKSAVLASVMAMASAPAFAGSGYLTLDEIVQATGMEKREVLLMVGPMSANPLYYTQYYRVSREWQRAAVEAGLVLEAQRDASGRLVAVRVRRGSDQA